MKSFVASLCVFGTIFANPQGATVISGDVSFDTSTDNRCVVTIKSEQATIEWENFSSDSNESIRFDLPHTNCSVVNRVVGNQVISLRGSLTSNGAISLVNQNGIENFGTISGQRIELKTAGSLLHEGFIEAESISIVASSGQCFVDGIIHAEKSDQTGGIIHVTGKSVEIGKRALLCARAPAGNGEIVIGGNNADETIVHTGAQIRTDAFFNGNGGNVTICSNRHTDFKGTITASGGIYSGHAGNIDVSHKQILNEE
jgi:filamentous hemagglutinin family protein